MTITYDLTELNEENQLFFYEMTPYISSHIGKIERDPNRLRIETAETYEEEVIRSCDRLKEMITGGKLGNKELPIRTIEDCTDRSALNTESVFEQLLACESIYKMADGAYAYGGIFLKIYKYFIAKIREFGFSTFQNLLEFDHPILYPVNEYEDGGYFENFPHYIMFQTVMKNDIEVLDRFAKEGTEAPGIFGEMKIPVNVMRHAACAPVYKMLSGKTISRNHPKAFLVSGKCFRNEELPVFCLYSGRSI